MHQLNGLALKQHLKPLGTPPCVVGSLFRWIKRGFLSHFSVSCCNILTSAKYRLFETQYLHKQRIAGRSSAVERNGSNSDKKNILYGERAISWCQQYVEGPTTVLNILQKLDKLGNCLLRLIESISNCLNLFYLYSFICFINLSFLGDPGTGFIDACLSGELVIKDRRFQTKYAPGTVLESLIGVSKLLTFIRIKLLENPMQLFDGITTDFLILKQEIIKTFIKYVSFI